MIITSLDQRLRLITQNDHAHFAAEILSLWRRDGVPENKRRDTLVFAAREHDNGWRESDAAPFHDPTNGRPHDFMTLPHEERWSIWRRGPRRYAEREPYAALLITRHALVLHDDHRRDPDWSEIFADWRQLEAELLETSGVDEETLVSDYRWIDLTDLFSLALCAGWTDPVERHSFRMEITGNELAVDPFPLAGSTTFRVPCREIPDRAYTSDADLAIELASARWGEYVVRLVPGPS